MTLQSVRFEAKRYSVVAPTLASRLWTIFEHVSLVSSAAGTVIFGSHHEELAIDLRLHHAGKTGVETWPAGATVEFHVRGKQRLATAGTHISTLAFFIVQQVGERALGTLVAAGVASFAWSGFFWSGFLMAVVGTLALDLVVLWWATTVIRRRQPLVTDGA